VKKEFKILNVALRAAGKIAKRYAGKTGYKLKGRANLVTKADISAQREIISVISAAFPEHGFLAEEAQKNIKTEGRYIWVIDPIDGTTNYAHNHPHSAVSIALAHKKEIVLGGVYDFFKEEIFIAQKGRGAKLNGKKICVSGVNKTEASLLATGFPYDRALLDKVHLPALRRFLDISHDIRRGGSAALDLCWVACGRLDGYWEFNLNPWDVCAGKLILEEAGGRVTDYKNKPWARLRDYGRQTLATNAKIHKQMASVLSALSEGR
jgi:myo-inositol-1(or 4)-monophosphatase